MKYILFILLLLIIWVLLLPIIMFRWDDEGFGDIVNGLNTMLDIKK